MYRLGIGIILTIAIFILFVWSSTVVKQGQQGLTTPKCECNPQKELTPLVPIPIVKSGQILPLSSHQWIMAAEETTDWRFGDNCLAEAGQSVLVIGTISPTEAIVRYKSNVDGGGSICPKNVLAVIDIDEYVFQQRQAAALEAKRVRILEAIRKEP